MWEENLQELEEYDSRMPDEAPEISNPLAPPPSEAKFTRARMEQPENSESPFLLGTARESRSDVERGALETGEWSSDRAARAGEFQGLEETEGDTMPAQGFDENLVPQTRGCSAGCPDPSAAEIKRIRPKGNPEGDFTDRTAGDPRANLSLQLFDYDVNAYLPTKAKHREALTRIREFIVQRTVEINERIAVTITGSASRTGSSSYNDVLSCKRANCVAENLRQSLDFFRGVTERVQINPLGEGFTRATCRGADCELGEWRSVLVQVHAPNNPPTPVPVLDPGWDKYTIRCCSFHTESLATGLLGDLLKKELPNLPSGLRSKILDAVRRGVSQLTERMLKQLPKLKSLQQEFNALLELFPADFIQETGVFEIRERDKPNARGLILCYSGRGLRLSLPRTNLDDFLDDALGKVGRFHSLPDFLKKQLKEGIKKLIPDAVKTLIQPIESDSPGPLATFNLRHPRNMKVFPGSVQIGKGVWMPGQVNVEFSSPAWTRPDPIERPMITTCPGTACNDSGVQTMVGDGRGLELFSISSGDLTPGSCACAALAPGVHDAKSEASEFESETESPSDWHSQQTLATRAARTGSTEDSLEFDPYADIRSALRPEHASLAARELTVILGHQPTLITLHGMLASPEPQLAALAALLGKAGRRSVRLHGSDVPISSYFRLLSRLCHEAAEQTAAESGPAIVSEAQVAPAAAALPQPRDIDQDAFFDDEWAPLPTPMPNPRNVHFSRFTTLTATTATEQTLRTAKPNPLDPRVTPGLIQPEVIPASRSISPGESYWIYIPDAYRTAVQNALAARAPLPTARVSVLFGVGAEVNRHGLRSFFSATADRILIEVGGIESVPEATGPWGIGITTQMIVDLLSDALGTTVPCQLEVLAAYSTGYRGLNGTINNSLVGLTHLQKLIFFDCLYRGDGPRPPHGASMPPKRHPEAPANSAFNTWRAIQAVITASSACQIIVYDVTQGGTKMYSDGKRMVEIPGATFIALKALNVELKAIILARLMDNGIKDGYFSAAKVPASVLALIPLLPKRGTLASNSSKTTPGTIGRWAQDNSTKIAHAARDFGVVMKLARTNQLMGWATPDTEFGHDGFLPEFGWEHLPG
jgi:outer membrane protein OmpA-like peptidoglycan-associated protein